MKRSRMNHRAQPRMASWEKTAGLMRPISCYWEVPEMCEIVRCVQPALQAASRIRLARLGELQQLVTANIAAAGS